MVGTSSREAQLSIAASSMFPGFRFSPTDEELISFYLKKKMEGSEKSIEVITEVEIWKYEPWDLPAKSVIPSNSEWFFFSPRGRKYPNGSQSRRATELGYWKATGKERNVKSGSTFIGTKRTLVFHIGRAPRGERTEWIMHEYCMLDKSQDFMVVCRLRKNSDFRLNDSTNQASSTQAPIATVPNSNCAVSDAGADQADKAVECCSKKSSSYDSYSIEQTDSATESNQKLTSEDTQPECSGHQKDHVDDDDFYAEILKDDIIKLDETPTPSGFHMRHRDVAPPENVQRSQEPVESDASQGTANRRIRLKVVPRTSKKYFIGEFPEESPKYIKSVSLFRIAVSRQLVLLLLLLTFMAFLGGFWRVRRVIYNSLYKGFLR
ncbi:NAC domain-containing protein 40-like [Humulus lupulus]|uniref:NAC domain-containing protein 40-like n=1 Tax=Humulus lupulus TaxID=3486 RepID=UPI002B40D6AA|nr:NAC domain-containing protein 40-like [Humulus lupulus]